MEELAYTKRLKGKIAGLRAQMEQVVASVNAIAGAIQFAEEELAEQAKDTEHGDGQQAAAE